MKIRKNIGLLKDLPIIVVAGAIMLIGAAYTYANGPSFTDVPETYESSPAITQLKNEGFVQGYPDGTFKPEITINRAEFLKIVLGTSAHTPQGKNCYPDVKDQWFAPYVCAATTLGFVEGSGGLFYPERPIVFAEAAKIVSNIHGLKLDSLKTGEEWFTPYVKAIEINKAIPPKISNFGQQVKRGEMAEMVWRIKYDITNLSANTFSNISNGLIAGATVSSDLVKFESCSLLKDHLLEAKQEQSLIRTFDTLEVADKAMQESSDTASANASTDFSTTNIQVTGVDEADIVKNDGEFIYILKGRTVRIVKAFPADKLEEVGFIEFPDANFTPNDMYLDGNQLVALGSSFEKLVITTEKRLALSIAPDIWPGGNTVSKVYIYDIKDRAKPVKQRELTIDGSVNSTRKVGDTVYVVSNKYNHAYVILEDTEPAARELLPQITDSRVGASQPVAGCDTVLYHPGEKEDNYIIVTAIPLDPSKATNSQTILGSSANIYSTAENLYLTEYAANWYPYVEQNNSTYIHRFKLDGTSIDYDRKGEVVGDVLNQFSMDEYKGNFRVVTTTYNDESSTNLFVLDEDLQIIGSITNIAPTENLHSVRFVGDRGYLVTFKKVDPLFVVDLATPKNPKILGELKIPGFSDYLHPVDENHIIGIGLDTIEAAEFLKEERNLDFAWYQGVKIAMFDVSDVQNPKELHKEIIGDRGTDTPLRYNHKALLWAPGKGKDGKTLMALPIRLAQLAESSKVDTVPNFPPYGEFVGQYAYVYSVSAEDGFELEAKITNHDYADQKQESGEFDYYRSGYNINRIVYIGDYLYAVSRSLVSAFELDSPDNYINDISLGGTDEPNYWWY